MEGHWSLWLAASLHKPSNLPVNAGFNVNGEEKNCEKCGSCAFRVPVSSSTKTTNSIFLISKQFLGIKDKEMRENAARMGQKFLLTVGYALTA